MWTLQCPRFNSVRTKISSWWMTQEIVALLRLAIPISLTLVLQQLPLFISLFFVGWINSDDSSINLDAASFGLSVGPRFRGDIVHSLLGHDESKEFVNITGLAVITGLASASDTLSSQTFGFGNFKRVGVIFQRGLIFLLLVAVFIICVWLNTESILLLLQQKPCVARYTAAYVNIFIVALPFIVLYVMLQTFLQTQSIVWPFIITGVLTNIVNAVAHAVFIFGLGFGIKGAAASIVIANVFQPIILIIYVKIRKLHQKTWGGWSLESLKKWPEYIKLAIPGMLMVMAEWASFDISSIVLGTISEQELAVNGILVAYATIIFMIPYGISVAVSIRVGNELGAGDVKRTKRTIYVSLGMMVINLVTVICVTLSLRTYIGALYNVEEEVNDRLKLVIYVLCVELLGDQTQAVLSGTIRGAGHQLRGAIVNLIAYYIFGLPIGITLALVLEMGAVGMWIGLAIATGIQAISYSIMLCCMNWSKEATLAMKRASQGTETSEQKSDNNTIELREEEENNTSDHGNGDHGNGDVADYDIGSGIDGQDDDLQDLMTHESISDEASISPSDENGLINSNDSDVCYSLKDKFGSHLKLILCHSVMVVIALVSLIVSGITSTVHPTGDNIINGNYSDCTANVSEFY